ncbi:molybdopterin-binding protein [Sebaldella sp. S0638]|uniref:molybdopterin-binding protein n=1 Tax=Sebaldella sp. S0638 TaxID=2957809 RepID=UPI00209F80A2|nr:molybdopterin-binding protein [Sebaldella sp. S0638]MCP1223022.1 molybdopterin-binding protein [Sebaldella sp. S0638]
MKKINVKEAVGMALCHDITEIIPGGFKGAKFLKGHIIKEEDVEVLLSLGKENIYIWEEDENYVHENDAAEFIKECVMGKGMYASEIREGKINFVAEYDGLYKINVELLNKINSIGEIIIASKFNNTVVKEGKTAAATRIIPLRIEKIQLNELKELMKNQELMEIKKMNSDLRVGIITTGSEIFYGRIKDKAREALGEKLGEYGVTNIKQVFAPDDKEKIKAEIKKMINDTDIILCTGGMSIDPDDVTPDAIEESGCEMVTYGTPVLPGAMFLLGYVEEKVIMGLPGGVVFSKNSVFDLLLPRILAGDIITKRDIVEMGHGGLLN